MLAENNVAFLAITEAFLAVNMVSLWPQLWTRASCGSDLIMNTNTLFVLCVEV